MDKHQASTVDPVSGEGPLLLSASQAAAMCGISIRQWWRWDSMGRVPTAVRIGSTKRWRHEELKSWIQHGCPARKAWEEFQKSTLEAKGFIR